MRLRKSTLGVRGANYGWPQCQGNCGVPGTTDPIFSYPHSGRDSSITGGIVYRGSQFPSEYRGSYFFGDYVQNTVRRLTFDGDGNVSRIVNFWPADGTKDSATVGDPVKFVEGPDGSLYYVDIGFNDAHEPNAAAIRRIRYIAGNQPPNAIANANPTSGQAPLPVTFSSAGSSDPEGAPLTYSWTFGDGGTSTQANPTHTYQTAGQYTARLTVSDGANSTLSAAVTIRVGNPPTRDDPHPRGQQPVPGRRRHQLLGERDGSRRRNVAGERVLLDDPVPPRHARAPLRRPVHEHEDRNAPDTDERTRLPRFDELRNRSDSHRLGRNNRIHLSDRRSGQGQPVIRHGSLRSDCRNRRNQQPSAVRPRRRQGLPSRHHRASASERRNLLHVRFVVGRRRTKPQHRRSRRTRATWPRSRRTGPAGLAAAYAFDEGLGASAADASGNGNTGAVGTAGWIATGKFGNALLFNGTNARVTVGDSPSLDLTTAMTLEAWVFPTGGAGQWRDVIYKGPDDIYYLESHTSNGPPATGGTFANPLFGTAVPPLNTWSHLASTYDGTTLRLYVNGVQVASRAQTGAIATSSGALTIGGDALYGQHFSGRIDEVRIYNSALSASEIQTDMNTPIGTPGSGHTAADGADRADGDGRLAEPDQPRLDGVDRQRRCYRLPARALPGRGLLELRPGRDADGDLVQRQRPGGGDELQLPRARGRCGRQPERLLERAERDHAGGARHAAADGALGARGDGRLREPDQPRLDGVDRQRRCYRLPARALPGRGLLELRPGRDPD